MGEIFCQVINKRQDIQFKPSIIEGNHKWKGIKLSFINKGIKINKLIFIIRKNIDLKIKKINNRIEAKAWIKKYFIVASIE